MPENNRSVLCVTPIGGWVTVRIDIGTVTIDNNRFDSDNRYNLSNITDVVWYLICQIKTFFAHTSVLRVFSEYL